MTSTDVKGMIVKGTLGAVAMGAFLLAGAAKAQAQVAVGVEFGRPAYVAPAYQRRDFAFERREAFLRQQEFARREAIARHEQWEREHRFYGHERERFYR